MIGVKPGQVVVNCWEYKGCPKDVYWSCPAFPNHGRDCWKVTGSRCEMGRYEKATIAEKLVHCRNCEFYVKYANKF